MVRALDYLQVQRTMKRRLTDEQRVAIGAEYLAGSSLSQIAQRFGSHDETIRNVIKKLGIPRRPRGSGAGALNHQFKGGERQRKDGYLVRRGSREKPLEHRVIAERVLGRKLKRTEVVHHINGVKTDNRNCNLLICTVGYHSQLHARMRKQSQEEI